MPKKESLIKKLKGDFQKEKQAQANLLSSSNIPTQKLETKDVILWRSSTKMQPSIAKNKQDAIPTQKQEVSNDHENDALGEAENIAPSFEIEAQETSVDDINVDEIEFKEYKFDPPSNLDGESFELVKKNRAIKSIPQARKREIGNRGEAIAYKKLKKCASPDEQTIWHNEEGEQGLPYDISQFPNNKVKRHEVKSTVLPPTSKQKKARFTANQVKAMREERGNYNIIRVYNVETKNPSLFFINDPLQKIFHLDRDGGTNNFTPRFPIKSFKLKI